MLSILLPMLIALHKTLTMVQQLEDINSKGMASEKQQ